MDTRFANKRHYTILLILSILSNFANGETIRMAFSKETPPYIFKESRGIEYDIIKEALAYKNHSLEPIFIPLGRIAFSFKNFNKINAAQRDNGIDLSAIGYYSDTVVNYHCCLISLKDSGINIKNPKQLKKYKIAGFQGAHEDIGFKNWLRYVNKENYIELMDQQQQAFELQSGQVEIIAGDLNVINHYNKTLLNSHSISEIKPIACKYISNKNSGYKAIFKSKKVRDDFNAGLRDMFKTGRIEAIYKQYKTVYKKI